MGHMVKLDLDASLTKNLWPQELLREGVWMGRLFNKSCRT